MEQNYTGAGNPSRRIRPNEENVAVEIIGILYSGIGRTYNEACIHHCFHTF